MMVPHFTAVMRDHKVDILADTALCGNKQETAKGILLYAVTKWEMIILFLYCYHKILLCALSLCDVIAI